MLFALVVGLTCAVGECRRETRFKIVAQCENNVGIIRSNCGSVRGTGGASRQRTEAAVKQHSTPVLSSVHLKHANGWNITVILFVFAFPPSALTSRKYTDH